MSESDTVPALIASAVSRAVIIFVVLAGARHKSGFSAPSTSPVSRSMTIAAAAVVAGSHGYGV